MPYKYVRPSEILYNQKSISNTFGDGHSLKETLNDLEYGRLSINDIPNITVFKRGSNWVTKNNRRLWVFRKLESSGKCYSIPVIVDYHANESSFRTDTVIVRGGADLVSCLDELGAMMQPSNWMRVRDEKTEETEVSKALDTAGGVAIGIGIAALIGGAAFMIGSEIAKQRRRDN